MQKQFEQWNTQKIQIHNRKGRALFHEREVWWCILGVNIGYEQDGGIKDFGRPVVILKKYNLDSCLIVPLTSRIKDGKYYFSVGNIDDRAAVAVLSQVRFVDRRPLEEKICMLDKVTYRRLLDAVAMTNFSVNPP